MVNNFFLLDQDFSYLCLLIFAFWSMWTLDWLPTYLLWTIMDIWLTTYLPQLVYAVFEWPLRAHCPNSYCGIEWVSPRNLPPPPEGWKMMLLVAFLNRLTFRLRILRVQEFTYIVLDKTSSVFYVLKSRKKKKFEQSENFWKLLFFKIYVTVFGYG